MKKSTLIHYQLLVDAGATKTEWCLMSEGIAPKTAYTSGINANALSDSEIREVISSVSFLSDVDTAQISYLFYGGAGCGNADNAARLKLLLSSFFPQAEIEVYSDLMGACRATCGNNEGMVAIIGTGASSCLFDGEKIIAQAPSLGWLLGDEGSGVYLGKMLITAYLQHELSGRVTAELENRYGFSPTQLVRQIAQDPKPNKFFATFPPFMAEFMQDEFMAQLCRNAFREFFRRFVACYDGYQSYTLNFIGSIAFAFQKVLCEVAAENKVEIGVIMKAPMPALQEYIKSIRY